MVVELKTKENLKIREMIPLFNTHNFRISELVLPSSILPSIRGMFVTPKGTVATDGFSLIMVDSLKIDKNEYSSCKNGSKPLENFPPFILPTYEAEKILRLLSKKQYSPFIGSAGIYKRRNGIAEIGIVDFGLITLKIIEDKYPRYQEILRQRGRYMERRLKADFLRRVADFFDAFISDKEKGLSIKIPFDPDQPLVFSGANGGQKATVLLMPMKME